MTDQEFLEALDLLDSLVDGNVDTVTKERVVTWKRMMRDRIARRSAARSTGVWGPRVVVAQSLMDQQPWVPGMDITPEQALTLADGVLRDLEETR